MPESISTLTRRSWWHKALDWFTLHPPKPLRTQPKPIAAAIPSPPSLVPSPSHSQSPPPPTTTPTSPPSGSSPSSSSPFSPKKVRPPLWRSNGKRRHPTTKTESLAAAGERLIKHIKSDDEFEELINGGQWVLVDFHADWCPPCKAIAPYFASQALELEQVIESMCPPGISKPVVLAKLDVDDFHELCSSANIAVMPTFRLYHDGYEVDTVAGCSKAGLDALFEDAMRRSGLIL